MPDRLPDAVIFPEEWKSGSTQLDRINSILSIAEPILGTDRSAGQKAWIRRQPGGVLFITNDTEDTLCFPMGHRLEGKPRYAWEVGRDGIRRGYLVDDARSDQEEARLQRELNPGAAIRRPGLVLPQTLGRAVPED